jgi:subtilase family serine protease
VQLSFSGAWDSPSQSATLEDANGDPITVTLDKSLEPGASTIVTVSYRAGSNGRDDLPVEITVVVDAEETQRECHEDNNQITGTIDAGSALADLRLVIDSAAGCTPPSVEVTLFNDGSASASDIVVRIYAGDPSQGGQAIGEVTIAGPIEPGESEQLTITLEHLERDVTLYGVADPLNVIAECNDANNFTRGPELLCYPITR